MTTSRPAESEHEHLTWAEIEAFFLRTEQPEERRPLYHLLTRCEACRDAAHPIPEMLEEGRIDGDSSWVEIELAVSEWEAPALWARLEADFPDELRPAERVVILRGDDRWPTWGLCVWLVHRSLATVSAEAEAALEWARLALQGALEMPPDLPAPDAWVAELRAFAQAAVGDATRRQGDLEGAREAFRQARRHLEALDDDGDFLPFRPVVFNREAAVLEEQGLLEEALVCLDEALEAWEVVYRHREVDRARILRHKARVLRRLHHLEEAFDVQEEVADLLTAEVA